MPDDDTIPRPSRFDGIRRALRWEIIPRRPRAARDSAAGGRVSRAKLNARIDGAPLPEPAKDLVRRVVSRTRLWRRERLDVADELIAHFADGLAAGETVDALAEAFGDERRAAKLIRRAKVRNRPLAWHAMRGLGRVLVGLVVLYAGLAVYFYAGRPSPAVNYVEVLNEPTRQAPADQRAWPLYREALLGMSVRGGDAPDETRLLVDARPGDERWPETVEWLAAHREQIELARRAAERPALGFVIGPGGSHVDPAMWPGQTDDMYVPPGGGADDENGQLLLSVLLPHLLELRTVASALAADAVLARQAGDRERWSRDVAAIHGIARQVRGEPFTVSQLVALGLRGLALEEIDATLSEAPQTLRDEDLGRLAHALAGPDVAGDLLDLRGERMLFHDLVQRAYTDDGDGDGRLTPEGLRLMIAVSALPRLGDDYGARDPLTLAGGPASLLLVAPRAELSGVYDRLIDAQAARFARPLHELGPSTLEEEVGSMRESAIGLGLGRYAPVFVLLPALERFQQVAERHLGHRDGVLAGLALELYKRRHGRYPETLDELTPDLLPAVPADRITGKPVRYRLVGGRPLVYSVGADRDDDGGRPPTGGPRSHLAESAAQWPPLATGSQMREGDWILFPQPSTHVPAPPRLPTTRPAAYGEPGN